MACYVVIFELKDASRLMALQESLKSFSGYCPLTDNSWAIMTEKQAKEVRDELAQTLDPSDRLFVIRSGTEGAWRNSYGEEHDKWLKDNL